MFLNLVDIEGACMRQMLLLLLELPLYSIFIPLCHYMALVSESENQSMSELISKLKRGWVLQRIGN